MDNERSFMHPAFKGFDKQAGGLETYRFACILTGVADLLRNNDKLLNTYIIKKILKQSTKAGARCGAL